MIKAAVITFPGSNCDRDLAVAFTRILGAEVLRIWHEDTGPPDVDLIGVPGGFSYGDYLRAGAISARAPVLDWVRAQDARGVPIIGICNGFQILTEAGLLPGALLRNRDLKFICRMVDLEVVTRASVFTSRFAMDDVIRLPIAHHDGNYTIDDDGLKQLQDQDRIAFRYVDNPNGSKANIAGILNRKRNVLGLMPHPERAIEPLLGGSDGKQMLSSLIEVMGA